jgi:hypothetical protein
MAKRNQGYCWGVGETPPERAPDFGRMLGRSELGNLEAVASERGDDPDEDCNRAHDIRQEKVRSRSLKEDGSKESSKPRSSQWRQIFGPDWRHDVATRVSKFVGNQASHFAEVDHALFFNRREWRSTLGKRIDDTCLDLIASAIPLHPFSAQ